MASRPEYSFDPKQRQITKRHADVVVEVLPDPGEAFLRNNLPDESWVRTAFDELTRASCMDIDEVVRRSGSPVNKWVIPEHIYQLAKHTIETRDVMLPCGHRGLQNRDGMLECRFDGCDERYSREEVTDV